MVSPTEVSLFAEFTAKPAHDDDVATLIQEYAKTVRAEPGNIRFDVLVHANDLRRYVILETYRDEAGFQAHLANSANATFNDAITHAIVETQACLTWLREESASLG